MVILLLCIGLFVALPINEEICDKTATGQKYNCSSQHVGLIGVRKIGKAFSDGNFVTGFITAVATAFIAWFTFTLRRSTDSLWDASERQLNHLEETAKRELRAYVVADAKDIRWPERNPIGEAVIVVVQVKNTGQTPAHDVRSNARTDIFPVPFPGDFDFSLPEHDDHSVGLIGPGESTGIEAASNPLTGDDWIVLRHDTQRRLCTYGTVNYRDVFGDPQHTNFCVIHIVELDTETGRITTTGQTARQHNDAS